jgi:dipeptidyl aminopeptidase/acylaminoacyl peptidase
VLVARRPDRRVRARAAAGRKLEPATSSAPFRTATSGSVDRATGRETRLLADAYNPSFSPDGLRSPCDAHWAGQRRIWIVGRRRAQSAASSRATSRRRSRTSAPRWSPDGKRIVFQNKESTKFDVRVVDVQTKRLTWVTNDLFQDLQPVWSPSGRHVYFSSYRSGG